MIKFHPTFKQLKEFSSGTSEPALALMISAHVDMCTECLHNCQAIQKKLSAEAFSHQMPLDAKYKSMVEDIFQQPEPDFIAPSESSSIIELDGRSFTLPRALSRYVKNTGNWSHLMGKLWQAPVDLGDIGKANFIYMEKGGSVPEHTHKGSEMTLVIDGQYSDGIDNYDCGDFSIMDHSNKHLPHSDADEGCLVFTIVDQPLYFTAGIARLLNPFSHLFFK
jgi:putative transcriptional regulator